MQFFIQRFIYQLPGSNPQQRLPRSTVLQGDCTKVMDGLPACPVDFILTDPAPHATATRRMATAEGGRL